MTSEEKNRRELLSLLNKAIKMFEEGEKFDNEFTGDLLQMYAQRYWQMSEGQLKADKETFFKVCKEKLYPLAEEFCSDFSNMYHHYLKTEKPYFKDMDYKIGLMEPELNDNVFDEIRGYSTRPKEELEEIFEWSRQEHRDGYLFEKGLFDIVKEFIAPYLTDQCAHFPGVAYREINYLCWFFSDEMSTELSNHIKWIQPHERE